MIAFATLLCGVGLGFGCAWCLVRREIRECRELCRDLELARALRWSASQDAPNPEAQR